MNENWSRAGSPVYPKPSCPALGATDWFGNLAYRAQSFRAGWTGQQDDHSDKPKVMSAAHGWFPEEFEANAKSMLAWSLTL